MTTYCGTPNTLRLETLDAAGALTNSLDLMDEASSYRVERLDVGFPVVREQVAALPTRDGELDYTRLYGRRLVTVTGNFVPSTAGASRQKALRALTWWCQPRLRPRLVYAVDADCAPVWLGVRGSQLASPVSNPQVSPFTVSWVAPDPVARALTPQSVTINVGTSAGVTNAGTYRAWPVLDIYGPCSDPYVVWASPASGQIVFALDIAAGHFVRVDTAAQTAVLDGTGASVYPQIDFHNTRWSGLEPGVTTLGMGARTSSSPARVVVTWADSSI